MPGVGGCDPSAAAAECAHVACVCGVCSVCVGSNSHTQEEALFPLSNDNRACVAMATGCAFYGLCV